MKQEDGHGGRPQREASAERESRANQESQDSVEEEAKKAQLASLC